MAKPKKKPVPKTDVQIKAEIKALEEIKPRVRRTSFFGEDNWEKIDAEIAVLKEDLDEDAIYDRWPADDEGGDNPPELDSALTARRWMDGDESEGLAESWETAAGGKK